MTAVPAGLDRRELGWALLLSVPVGVGVTFAVNRMVGGSVVQPLAIGAGVVTATVIFSIILASMLTPGETDRRLGRL